MELESEPHPKRRVDAMSGVMMLLTLVALVGAGWLWFGRSSAPEASSATVGADAPPLRLVDPETSKPIVLTGLNDKVVWLVFWSATSPSGGSCLADVQSASRRLRERGKDPNGFVSAIASYAARAARSGRTVCGQQKAKDVLSPLAQQRHGFYVGKLPDFETLVGNPLFEALCDNTVTPPDEQVAFRIDFPCWVAGYDERKRRIIRLMMTGEPTQTVARRLQLSPARVSQLRREFKDEWDRFTGVCA